MIKIEREVISSFCLIFLLLVIVFLGGNLEVKASTIKQNDELIERIAKDFSKKFCNGVGFGLSQESAVDFAIKENVAIFKKRKGIENIDTKAIAEKVSISVVDKCGYVLKLSEELWGETFKKGEIS